MARVFVPASLQYLSYANPPITSTPFSVGGWLNWYGASGNHAVFSIADSSSTSDVWLFYCATGATDNLYIFAGDSGGYGQENAECTQDVWHHGLAVLQSDNLNRDVYVDGIVGSDNNDDEGTPLDVDLMALGFDCRSGQTNYFDGVLAEWGLWNVALTAAEALILASGVSPLLVRPQSLVHYWPIIGRLSPEIDVVGGYDLTVNNGPVVANHPRIAYPVPPQIIHGPAPVSGKIQRMIRPLSNEQTRQIAALRL